MKTVFALFVLVLLLVVLFVLITSSGASLPAPNATLTVPAQGLQFLAGYMPK